jgi:hypothetical protein
MRGWWKMSKRGWAHRRWTSLTQAYKNLFPDTTSASVPAVTVLRSSLSMYVFFFVHNKFCFLIACFVNSSPEDTFRIALIRWHCQPKSSQSVPMVCHIGTNL